MGNKTILNIQSILFGLLMCILPLTATGQETKSAKLIFAGDMSIASGWEQYGDKKHPVDVVFGSLTSNIQGAEARPSNDYTVALSLSSYGLVKGGNAALKGSTSKLKEARLNFAGLQQFQDFTSFSHKGMKYGFASFGNTPQSLMKKDSIIIKTIISRLKFKSDIVVVGYSYDTKTALSYEESDYLSELRYFTHLCVDAGADVVYVSGYPSILPIELYGDRLIIYGQSTNKIEVNINQDGSFESGRMLTGSDKIWAITQHYFPQTALTLDKNGMLHSGMTQAQGIVKRMLAEAVKYRGRPYVYGSTGPRSFDCSGFTGFVYKLMGYNLPRTSSSQYTIGRSVTRQELMPGDLVFFTRATSKGRVGHVGIVYSVDPETKDFSFIHASTSRGVTIDNFGSQAYYVKRYVGAKRVIEGEQSALIDNAENIDTPRKNAEKTTIKAQTNSKRRK